MSKIIRFNPEHEYDFEVFNKIVDKGIRDGESFGLQIKVGKRRKLKRVRLIEASDYLCCEDCGREYKVIVLFKGEKIRVSQILRKI